MCKRREREDDERRKWVMCCGILLVLHVDIDSSVCYTMVVNLFLSSLVVDSRKRRRRKEVGSRERRRRVGHWVSYSIVVDLCFVNSCGIVFVIEMSMLMCCRGWGATWNVSHAILLLQLHCVRVSVLYQWCGPLCINWCMVFFMFVDPRIPLKVAGE